ncbi:MAG: class I SAM-dependent methyltransferase [Phycisphaerae bacterium]|nr:class I SAM-dependent methyltransferase [Phycisphaerae bacterium]NUQ45178.1 class I SAM-dependent methyltransferase [Phycisphaerae bacterium]
MSILAAGTDVLQQATEAGRSPRGGSQSGPEFAHEVRAAYEQALLAAGPTPAQIAWRLGRFDRGIKLLSEIEYLIGPIRGGNLLDVGAAHGGDACAAIAFGMDVTLVDFRDHGYAELQRTIHNVRSQRRLEWELFDVNRNWPLADREYDALLAMAVIDHVADLSTFFHEVHRVLRPNGWAVVQTALALPNLHRDAHFGLPLVSALPMRLKRWVSQRIMGRSYSCPLANRTHYTVRPVTAHARRANLYASAHKYADSPLANRVRRWPLPSAWLSAVKHVAADFVIIQKKDE